MYSTHQQNVKIKCFIWYEEIIPYLYVHVWLFYFYIYMYVTVTVYLFVHTPYLVYYITLYGLCSLIHSTVGQTSPHRICLQFVIHMT